MSPLPYESMLVLLAAMGLFLPLLKKGDRAWLLSVLALAASLALSVATLYLSMASEPCYLFSKMLRLDPYGSLFSTLALLGALLAVLASKPASKWTTSTSFYSLTLISMVGVCVIAFANDITVALAAWLLSSVASYAIVSLAKDEASAEGGVKYAIMGSASTVFLFMGTFILFLSAGTTLLSSTLRPIPLNPVFGGHTVLVLSILLVVAIGFKMGIFPFQAWLPDTYGGVHPSLIAFVIPMAKALALLALYRLVYPVAVQYPETWFVVASVFSVLTMFFGNLAALLQDDAQRMMAYSSIAHAGYFFVGFAGISALSGLDPKWAMMGLLIHYAAYSLAKVGIFAGLEEVKEKVGGVMLSDLSGLGRRMPVTSSMLLILLLSLMGAPPLLGFWGKLYLFASVVGLSPLLALLAILNSAISVAYYARVIKAMYFSPGDYERIPERGWPLYSIIASAILTVLLGLVASPLAEMVVP